MYARTNFAKLHFAKIYFGKMHFGKYPLEMEVWKLLVIKKYITSHHPWSTSLKQSSENLIVWNTYWRTDRGRCWRLEMLTHLSIEQEWAEKEGKMENEKSCKICSNLVFRATEYMVIQVKTSSPEDHHKLLGEIPCRQKQTQKWSYDLFIET